VFDECSHDQTELPRGQDQIHDLLEKSKKCQAELDQERKGFKESEAIRGKVDGVLQAKLKTIEAQIEENNYWRQKIQSVIFSCQGMAKLSPEMTASFVIRKEVKQLKKLMKEQVEQTESVLNRAASSETKVHNQFPYCFIIKFVF